VGHHWWVTIGGSPLVGHSMEEIHNFIAPVCIYLESFH